MIKVHKAKIPPHLSFAFKTSMLERVMQEVGAECPAQLEFHEPKSNGTLLKAQYRISSDTHEPRTLYVHAGAVANETRKAIVDLFEGSVLLELMVWLDQVLQLPDNSRILQAPPTFHATYTGGKLHVDHDFQ